MLRNLLETADGTMEKQPPMEPEKLDLKKTVYAFTFHPQFAKNGYVYITYILDPKKDQPEGTRVSRFTVKGSPPRADLASEKIILVWPSGGHNGGCLKFGLDGFLYIAVFRQWDSAMLTLALIIVFRKVIEAGLIVGVVLAACKIQRIVRRHDTLHQHTV